MGGLLGILGFFSVFCYPLFVLRPIVAKARSSAIRIKARFTILDLFSLFFLIQIPAVLIAQADFRKNEIPAPTILGMLAATLVWLAGIRALNHIGIDDYKKRLAAIGVVFPFAIAGGFVLFGLLLWLISEVIPTSSADKFGIHWPILALIVLAILTMGIRRLCYWIAGGSETTNGVAKPTTIDPLA